MNVIDYTLATGTSLPDLITATQAAIENGFTPFGSVFEYNHTLCQPMVKYGV